MASLRCLAVAVASLALPAAAGAPGGAPRRFLSAEEQLPNRLGDRRLVAVGQQIRLETLHIYDLAVYVSNTSSLWGRRNLTREDLIDEAPRCTLRCEITFSLVTAKLLSESMAEDVKGRVSAEEWKAIDGNFAWRFQKAPWFGLGSIIYLELHPHGVRITVDGEDMGMVVSPAISRALFSIYFDTSAVQQDFVALTLRTISEGLPPLDWWPTLLVEHSASVFRTLIFVGSLSVGACCLLVCAVCFCRCWLRRRRAENDVDQSSAQSQKMFAWARMLTASSFLSRGDTQQTVSA